MEKKIIYGVLIFLWILTIPTSIIKIENKQQPVEKKESGERIGTIIIEKIQLNEPLYKINSSKNNIEEHVTILKESTPPTEDNSIMILAAHSGDDKISYFEYLDQIEIGDTIHLIYQQKKYSYQVKEIWEEIKNGFIHINKEKGKQLVLTTCSPNKEKWQLIINCTEKGV